MAFLALDKMSLWSWRKLSSFVQSFAGILRAMTLTELLQNEELRRHEFPVVAKGIYLAHAGVCPLPRRVAEAMQRFIQESTLEDQEVALPETMFMETRGLAAKLLGAQPDEIAFVVQLQHSGRTTATN